MKNYKVGFFGDDIWAHNTVKLLSKINLLMLNLYVEGILRKIKL